MIGNGNIALGPAFVIQEDYAVKSPQTAIRTNAGVNGVAMIQQTFSDKQWSQQQQQQQQPNQAQDQQSKDVDSETSVDNNADSNQVKFIFRFS